MTAGTFMGENCFTGRMEKNGETLLQLWLGYSFNSNQTIGNLKELKISNILRKIAHIPLAWVETLC